VSRALELELQYAIETFKHPEAARKAAEFK
jgi:hypothetical protein